MLTAKAKTHLTLLAALFIASACGGEDPDNGLFPPDYVVPDPEIRQLAPTNISLGEPMAIYGANFIESKYGETRVQFEGNYVTSAGKVEPVRMEVTPKYVSQGQLTWTFGPNVPFGSVQDVGSFLGTVKVRNIGKNNEIKNAKQALSAKITVKPSIVITQMRPLGSGCSANLTDTIANTKFLFEVNAVGLQAGTQAAPLRVIYTFMMDNFKFEGWFTDKLTVDPEALFPKTGPVSVVDTVSNGTISKLGSGTPDNVYVNQGTYLPGSPIGTTLDKLFGLVYLYTNDIGNTAADHMSASMNIVAIDSTGQVAKRAITLKIWNPIEVAYNGASRVVQSFDPIPVSGCISGSDIGTEVTYSESTSETRARSVKYKASVAAGFDIKVAKLNAEFGIEVDKAVSSSTSKDLKIGGKILPKQFGVFYRQTLQLERSADLTAHGPCGSTQDLGQVIVTDWTWSPDLAKGNQCPPLPPSNLAKGQTL